MINTIILDIGNVLAHFRWKEYLVECGYGDETIRKVASATVLNKRWKEFDRGVLNEVELIAECCNRDPSVAREIMVFFDQFVEVVKEFNYSVEFIEKLKANGYKVYLLSNYGRSFFEHAKKNFEFLNHVDGGIISYEVKCVKPEPEIYEALIHKYNFNPNEAVFLDDMQENLDGAKPFGFHTILVKEFDKAIEDLRTLGVRV